MRETTAAQCPIHPMETQPCPACLDALDNSMASYNAGYAAGYRAAQAAMPPREPTRAMVNAGEKRRREIAGRGLCIGTIWCAMYDAWAQEQTSGGTQQRPEQANASVPESRTGPLDHQSAVGTNCATECAVRAPESSARGPAADPIADLCAELRATHCSNENLHDNAAYELERPARTERLLQACIRHETARAERAEAERDALRAVVRAADAMRAREHAHDGKTRGCVACSVIAAYDERRAKWKDNT